jgi:hypothetical protein
MLGHLGVHVPDLRAAKKYCDAIMPAPLEAVCHHDRD